MPSRATAIVGPAPFDVEVAEAAAASVVEAAVADELALVLVEVGALYEAGSRVPQSAFSASSHAFCAVASPALFALHSVCFSSQRKVGMVLM